jgi:hypothetical protein
MMIVAEKKIARFTSDAAKLMVPSLPVRADPSSPASSACVIGPPGCSDKCRKTFSTMITVASTIRPKSMAPSDSRLADSPRITKIATAKARANGIVAATMMALRSEPRNSH